MPGNFGSYISTGSNYSYVYSHNDLRTKLRNISLSNLSREAEEAKEDAEFEYSDPENGYKTADFILKNHINIKNLKQHLRNGYKQYEYLALKIVCLKLEDDGRFNEANAIYENYERL